MLFHCGLRWHMRLGLGALIGATLAVAWFQGQDWVSGWAPPLLALLLVVWLRSPRWGALLTFGGALGVQLAYPYFYDRIVVTALETGGFLRLDAWRGTLELLGSRWPIGLGLAAYVFYWNDLCVHLRRGRATGEAGVRVVCGLPFMAAGLVLSLRQWCRWLRLPERLPTECIVAHSSDAAQEAALKPAWRLGP
jgi:hypothetical protein